MENVNEIVHKFPCAGQDNSQAFMDQPVRPILEGADYARTTIKALNVRAMDPASGSLRGASRPGLTRYIPSQVNGSGLIQDLDVVVWTSPAALGSGGGGYQPYPIDKTMAFTMQVGYVSTSSGFQVVVRLVESTPKARTSSLTQSLGILNPVTSPLADFLNANNGYQVEISVQDQNGNVVQVNGVNAITQPLRMNSMEAVTYLGIAPTSLNWTQTYLTNPGTPIFTVTVTLLDSSGSQVPNLNSAGNPSGGNVQQQFPVPPTIYQMNFMVMYVAKPIATNSGPPIVAYAAFRSLDAFVYVFPILANAFLASFWSTSKTIGLLGWGGGNYNFYGSNTQAYTGIRNILSGATVIQGGVYMSSGMSPLSIGGASLALQPENPTNGTAFDFNVGVYGAYFSSVTTQAELYDAIAAFAPTVGF
jgi:hypothetical protein